jgi:hypothetical protein
LGKAQRNWIPAIGRDSKSAALQTKAAAPGITYFLRRIRWPHECLASVARP